MKGLLIPTGIMVVLTACSGSAKQDSTEPRPASGEPGSSTQPTTSTPSTTGKATGGSPTPGAPPSRIVCPSLQIKAPDVVTAGRSGRVNLIVTDPGASPSYSWTVSAGSIESGQGTTSISVKTSGDLAGMSVIATVTLGNLPAECESKAASVSFLVGS